LRENPSFRPTALPVFETGENVITLDTVPSYIRVHAPTGLVAAEAFLRLRNQLFREENAIPIRFLLRGQWEPASSQVRIEAIQIEAITPPDDPGPFPLE
jgi:hypothetical protein